MLCWYYGKSNKQSKWKNVSVKILNLKVATKISGTKFWWVFYLKFSSVNAQCEVYWIVLICLLYI